MKQAQTKEQIKDWTKQQRRKPRLKSSENNGCGQQWCLTRVFSLYPKGKDQKIKKMEKEKDVKTQKRGYTFQMSLLSIFE